MDNVNIYEHAYKRQVMENDKLIEEIELLKLRIKKLEEVNLPVIIRCKCK